MSQWIQQGSAFYPPGQLYNEGFCNALSEDGNTLIIGSNYPDVQYSGVFIYTRTGNTWTQQQQLIGTGYSANNNGYGYSVALSEDGNTAAVSAPNDSNNKIVATWIFTRSNNIWTQQGPKLIGTGYSVSVSFFQPGSSVKLSDDTLAVGSYLDGVFSNNHYTGAVWIFTRTNNVWTQQGPKLVATGSNGSGQGFSLSLSGDLLIVGAPSIHSLQGAVFIFKRINGIWSQVQKIIGSGGFGGQQGYSLSYKNNFLVFSSITSQSINSASVYIFQNVGGTFSQVNVLSDIHFFGNAVSVSNNFLVVSQYGTNSVNIYKLSDYSLFQTLTINGLSNTPNILSITDDTLAIGALSTQENYIFVNSDKITLAFINNSLTNITNAQFTIKLALF